MYDASPSLQFFIGYSYLFYKIYKHAFPGQLFPLFPYHTHIWQLAHLMNVHYLEVPEEVHTAIVGMLKSRLLHSVKGSYSSVQSGGPGQVIATSARMRSGCYNSVATKQTR